MLTPLQKSVLNSVREVLIFEKNRLAVVAKELPRRQETSVRAILGQLSLIIDEIDGQTLLGDRSPPTRPTCRTIP